MGNGEEPGVLGTIWNFIKKVACAVVCAWFEILVAILVFVLVIFTVAVTFFLFFIGVDGDSLLVALS